MGAKRERALATIRFAGYHGDSRTALRAYVENHVSFKAYLEAFRAGEKAKRNGVPCTCPACKKG